VKCMNCTSAKTEVFRTVLLPTATQRERRCACGARFLTVETLVGTMLPPAPRQQKETKNATGSDQPASRQQAEQAAPHSSSGSVSSGSDQASSKPSDAPAMKPAFVGLPLAAKGKTWDVTAAFDTELANGFPAIDRQAEYQKAKIWLLASPANRKTEKGMERFLFHWFTTEQNRGGKGAARATDTRCHFHRSPGTNGKRPPAGWFSACPECKHGRAGGGTRAGEPASIADLAAATEAKLARDRSITPASPEQIAELRASRGGT